MGRQRKRKAHKNTARIQSKDIVIPQLQQLLEREVKVIRLQKAFLIRNFNKVIITITFIFIANSLCEKL